MNNVELKSFYDRVYKKGERSHYTKLLLSPDKITLEKSLVIKELNWKGKSVLDIGCGTGQFAYLVSQKGARTVLGIDYSSLAIELARSAHSAKNLRYQVADAASFKGSFDAVLAMGMLEHTDKPYGMLAKFAGFLKPSGSLIVTAPNWSNPRGYMLMMLYYLFGAKITLADLHYFTPLEFEAWAKRLGMKLTWKTADHDWACGEKLIRDFKRRIPNVLRDSGLPNDSKRVRSFVKWLAAHIPILEAKQPAGGAIGLYHFKRLT